MTFGNTTIRSQVLVLVAFIVAAVLVGAIIVFSAMERSDRYVEQLKSEALGQQSLIKRIADVYAMDVVDTTFRVRNGLLDWDRGAALLEGRMRSVDESWKALAGGRLEPGEKAWMAASVPKRESADTAALRLLQILRARDIQALGNFAETRLYPSIDPITHDLKILFDMQSVEVDHILAAQKANTLHTELTSVGLMAFSFLVMALLAASMIRGMVRGAESLVDLARSMKDGKLDAKLKTRPSGELGVLADAFDSMRESILEQQRALRENQVALSAALSRQTNQFDAFMEHAPAGIWSKDRDGRFQFINRNYYDMFGLYPDTQAAGSTDYDFFAADAAARNQANDRRVAESGKAERFVEHHERDGRMQHVLSVKFPLRDADGQVIATAGMCLDISEQVQLQERLTQINNGLQKREIQLLGLSREQALDTGDLPRAFTLITEAACAGLTVQRAGLWFFDDARGAITCRHLLDLVTGASVEPLELRRETYPSYFRALDSERTILAHDARIDPHTAEFRDGYLQPLRITSMLDVPVRFRGEMVGVLCCEHVGPVRHWSDEEGYFASALADAVTRALTSHAEREAEVALRQLNAELEQRIADRTAEAEEARRRVVDITDSVPGFVFEFLRRADGSYCAPFVSGGVEALVGITRDTVIGDVSRYFALVVPGDARDYLAAIEDSAVHGLALDHAFRVHHARSGELRWLHVRAHAPSRRGDEYLWRGYISDISRERRLQDDLETTSDRSAQAQRAGRVGTFDMDLVTGANFWSDVILEIYGTTRERFDGSIAQWQELLHPEDRERVMSGWQSAVEGRGTRHVFEFRIPTRDGGLRWLRSDSRLVRDEGGKACRAIGINLDITEEKESQAALAQLREVAEAASQRITDITDSVPGFAMEWTRHADGRASVGFVSRGIETLTGVSREALQQDAGSYFAVVAPEDVPGYLAQIDLSEQQNREFRYAFRIRHARSGALRWLNAHALAPTRREGEVTWRGYVVDITEAKRLEEELARAHEAANASHQRVIDITDHVPGVVFEFLRKADGSYHFPFASTGIAMLGDTREAIMADASAIFHAVPAEDVAAFIESIERSATQMSQWDHVWPIREPATGATRWLQGRSTPGRVGEGEILWRGVITDITEAKRLQEELAAAKTLAESASQRVLEMTNNVPGVVYEFLRKADGSYSFPFASSRVVDYLGATREAVEAQAAAAFAEVFPEDMPGMFTTVEHSAATLTPWEYVWRVRDAPTGTTRWLQGRSTPVRAQEGEVLWRGVMIDITEAKRLQEELAKAREAAESAARTKGDFLANMSHEIRTPMNAIIGMAHLALKTDLQPRQRDYLNKIHGAGQSLLGIINDILDFSKIEAGKLTIEHIEFSLDAVLDNVTSMISQKAVEKGVEFIVSRSPHLPDQLTGDPLRLSQVLINLANNAIKFTSQGEVEIEITPREVDDSEIQLAFSIRDTGIGLTQEQCSRLFNSFAQADSSTTRKYGGTGLGLVISRQLVEMMDGEIGVESVHGKGSTFWFTARFGCTAQAARPVHAIPESLRELRTLIVDDNPTAREILRRYLESFGFAYAEAGSGERALDLLRQADPPFGLVLLDWKMPGMDGFATAREIRRMPGSQAPRVIMVSAYSREELMQQADDVGLDAYLLKPVNPSLLYDTILQAFGEAGANGQAARQAQDPQHTGGLAGVHALLVEDNEINRQIATELLEDAGIVVTAAYDGQQALDLLLAPPSPPAFDLVLMDMQMPVMDGVESTRRIRADGRFAALPIIAMTANAMQQDRERCAAAGMNDHLSKPINVGEMFATIRRWTGRGTIPGDARPLQPQEAVLDPSTLPRLPQVDMEAGLRRVGGNARRLRKAWLRFRETQAGAADRIEQAARAADWPLATREAHTLKGLAATLGADALADAAAQLEIVLKSGEPRWSALLGPARAQLDALIPALDELARGANGASTNDSPPAALDGAAVQAMLDRLVTELDDDDTAATKTLDALESALGGHIATSVALGSLRRAVTDYDFDGAKTALAPLRAALSDALQMSH